MSVTIVDTGPLVAYLSETDTHHVWAVDVLSGVTPPLQTCESVLSEAQFLLKTYAGGADPLFALLERDLVRVTYRISAEEVPRLRSIVKRYRNLPASLADACLVRMAEQSRGSQILTLDSHFAIYRLSDRRVIPTLMPRR